MWEERKVREDKKISDEVLQSLCLESQTAEHQYKWPRFPYILLPQHLQNHPIVNITHGNGLSTYLYLPMSTIEISVFPLLWKSSMLCLFIPAPSNHWPFNCFHTFAFSRMSQSWSQIVHMLLFNKCLSSISYVLGTVLSALQMLIFSTLLIAQWILLLVLIFRWENWSTEKSFW